MKSLFTRMSHGLVAALCCTVALNANAFPTSKYSTNSKLSSGRWVKIAIPADGVYELTQEELQQMGFSDIANVRIYGNGGHMIKERLDGTAIDDIKPVASRVINGKLCFYGKGPIAKTFVSGTTPSFSRQINAYSTQGYYFLTEGEQAMDINTVSLEEQHFGSNAINTSYNCYYHEQELFSWGQSGKDLFGEDITNGGSIDFTLPEIASDTLTVQVVVGAKLKTAAMNLVAKLTSGGKTYALPYTDATTKIPIPNKSFNYYNSCSPMAQIVTNGHATDGKIDLSFTGNGLVLQGALDNIIITYKRNNVIGGAEGNQATMTYPEINDGSNISLPGATPTTIVWRIDDTTAPVEYQLKQEEGTSSFAPNSTSQVSNWVMFDPAQTLMKISGYEEVANQNLHALPVPDMLIITNKTFMQQAQRIIDMHRATDGLNVIAVDEQEIFNEFSSGTPDAMAYRLMCKMLYDRNKSKFKYLLLLGEGSFDNRGIVTVKPNRILTYQSDQSYHEDYSFTCDDFFGYLDDNSGDRIAATVLRLGVGRIPSTNEAEAASDIDKLIKYVMSPDYGPWRNNIFFAAETGDDDLHITQAENNLKQFADTKFEKNKVYIDMYPRAVNEQAIVNEADRTSKEANRRFHSMLNQGQYYGTYIGHAGPRKISKSGLFSAIEAVAVSYPHLPIFMTACCDVARFDSDERGIAEHMFHNPNGGAIALLTSTREVYASYNELLNKYWVNNLFGWNTTKTIPTLGQAYMKAKQQFGTTNQPNKCKFMLLGDPAMQVAYPRPLFSITSINGTDVTSGTSVSVEPLQQVEVTAKVMKDDGKTLDTDFNGKATLTIYDKEVLLKNTTVNQIAYTINNPRDILTQVEGRVENGIFNGTAVMPRYCKAVGEGGEILVYAHREGTDLMVNGSYSNLTINEISAGSQASDDNAPVINSMYLNEESSFTDGGIVSDNAILYINASDNLAINNQSLSMGHNMRLELDGNTSYYLVNDYATVSDGGRQLDIAFPLSGLKPGPHSLSFTVHDVAGNSASRTIAFVVGEPNAFTLSVAELPATTQATFDAQTAVTDADVTVKVTDALGRLVWKSTGVSFPLVWDLKDMEGNRVKGGRYKVFGNYTTTAAHGGTNVADLLVIDPVK